jgi:hypothetical protein
MGYHNAQFCSECKVERAREASSKTWQKMKIARERKKSQLYGRRVSEFDISEIDMKLADRMGKSQGSFQLWKLRYPEKYEEMLLEYGYRVVDGVIYQSETSKSQHKEEEP